jgi:hypothetical protein
LDAKALLLVQVVQLLDDLPLLLRTLQRRGILHATLSHALVRWILRNRCADPAEARRA